MASTAASPPEFAIFGFHFAADNPEFMVLGRPLRAGRATLVPRSGPGRSHDLVRPEPAAQPPRSCAADPARQRGRRRGDGRQRPGLQGARLPGLLDARRAVGRALRPVHRSGGAGELLVAAVRAVPRHDRPGRSGLGVGRRRRRRVRERAAPGVPGVRRLVALHRRARLARDRGEPGGRLSLRPRDRPRGALRARRTRRPRPQEFATRFATAPRDPTPPHASRSAHNPKRSPTHENQAPSSSSTRRDRHVSVRRWLRHQGIRWGRLQQRRGEDRARHRGQHDHARCPHRPDRRLRRTRQGHHQRPGAVLEEPEQRRQGLREVRRQARGEGPRLRDPAGRPAVRLDP